LTEAEQRTTARMTSCGGAPKRMETADGRAVLDALDRAVIAAVRGQPVPITITAAAMARTMAERLRSPEENSATPLSWARRGSTGCELTQDLHVTAEPRGLESGFWMARSVLEMG
jgi:hypothetical protein